MKKSVLIVLAVVVATVLGSGPASAHHSLSPYDMQHMITLKGTVTAFNFINPHVSILFDVKNDKGNIEKWQMDLLAPNRLIRLGWNAESLKPGDQVTFYCHLYKDGRKVAYLDKVVLANGQELSNRSANGGNAA